MSNFVSQKSFLLQPQHFPEALDVPAFVYFLTFRHSIRFQSEQI